MAPPSLVPHKLTKDAKAASPLLYTRVASQVAFVVRTPASWRPLRDKAADPSLGRVPGGNGSPETLHTGKSPWWKALQALVHGLKIQTFRCQAESPVWHWEKALFSAYLIGDITLISHPNQFHQRWSREDFLFNFSSHPNRQDKEYWVSCLSWFTFQRVFNSGG